MNFQLIVGALNSLSYLVKAKNLKSNTTKLGAGIAVGHATAIETGYPLGETLFPGDPEKAFALNAGVYCIATLLFLWKGKNNG